MGTKKNKIDRLADMYGMIYIFGLLPCIQAIKIKGKKMKMKMKINNAMDYE